MSGKGQKRSRFNYEEGDVQSEEVSTTGETHASGTRGGRHGAESTMPMMKTIDTNTIQRITVKHFRREWYEIDTGLHLVPCQHLFNSLFEDEFVLKLNHAGLTQPWLYVTPFIEKLRVSNPIVLSDNITTGTTVNEVSSFVQSHKLVHFQVRPSHIGNHYVFRTGDEASSQLKCTAIGGTTNKTTLLARFAGDDYTLNDVYISGVLDHYPAGTTRINRMSTKNGYGRFLFKVSTDSTDTDPNTVAFTSGRTNTVDFYQRFKNYDCKIVDCDQTVNLHRPEYQSFYNFGSALFNNTDSAMKNFVMDVPTKYTTAVSSAGTTLENGVYGMGPILKNFGPATISDLNTDFTDQELKKQLQRDVVHDYLTLIPIKKTDDSFMKLRANVMVEAEYGFHMYFFPRLRAAASTQDFVDFLHNNQNVSPGIWPNVRGYSADGLGNFVF